MSLRFADAKTATPSITWRRGLLPAMVLAALAQPAAASDLVAMASPASPSAVTFDADFFPSGTAPKMDLSRFEKSDFVAPGTYRGDIVLNKEWRARTDIVYANVSGTDDSQPCFTANDLTSYGVDLSKLAADPASQPAKPIPQGKFCGPLGDYIPGATTSFDAGAQVLTLTVPQIYVQRAARGYVDPSQWDAGINTAVVGYNANLYRMSGSGRDQTSGYLGLNASLHLNQWQLYHLGSLSWLEGSGRHYQSNATYLQHDVPSLSAQFVAGDTFTTGEFFDSVRLRGARLYSDDRMLPQSMRGYAPIVRGIADTNAHVIIRQHGYIIYDANVAPGPFAIDDLYPTGYGGDLDVQVIEADGRVKQFSVPFSAVPNLLRPGQIRWSIALGKVEQQNLLDSPMVAQGFFQRGLTNAVTGYAGATFANGYGAGLVGAAFNTNAGAFSADLTRATNETPGQRTTTGSSLRVGYNKNFVDTGTNFAMATYRYSTSGYVSLNDSVSLRDAQARGLDSSTIPRQRSRLDLSVNQTLGKVGGQLFVTGSRMNYWGASGRQTQFTAGYSNQWHSITYSLSAQRTRESTQTITSPFLQNSIPGAAADFLPTNSLTHSDTRFFLTATVPLGRASRAPSLTAMLNRSSSGGDNSQVSVSGTTGADSRISYGAALSHSGGGSAYDLHGQYNGQGANVVGSYSQGSGYSQFGAGASGGVVVHGGGITFSPPLGDTVGLVYAPDASGARVENGQGAVVDAHGYAVVPYLMPYQLNTVTLDPKGTSTNVELKDTARNVAPRAGSVALLRYETTSGQALLIDTQLPDGRPIPFGADVLDDKGNNVGVAGQASRLYLHGALGSGSLTVKWGDGAADTCHIQIQPPPASKGSQNSMETMQAACLAPGTNAAQAIEGNGGKPVAMLDAERHQAGVEDVLPLPKIHQASVLKSDTGLLARTTA